MAVVLASNILWFSPQIPKSDTISSSQWSVHNSYTVRAQIRLHFETFCRILRKNRQLGEAARDELRRYHCKCAQKTEVG